MRYSAGVRRKNGRRESGGGAAERFFFCIGLIAVGAVLALSLRGEEEGRTEPEREAVAVMSRTEEDIPAEAEEDGSVFDAIGAFFAGLLAGRRG